LLNDNWMDRAARLEDTRKDVEFLVRNLRERWANMWNSYAVLGKTYFRGTQSNLLRK